MLAFHLHPQGPSYISKTRIYNPHWKAYAAKFRTLQTHVAREPFRILFMGRDEFSCLVLEELYRANDVWKEIIIATQPDVYTGRRRSVLTVSPLKTLGTSLGVPIHTIPEDRKAFRTWPLPHPFHNAESPSNMLITASFGRIISNKMLDAFQPSCRLNIHPSLLPAYRGPAPIQHTILENEVETGVCVIEMLKKREGIDAGSLWGVDRMKVPKHATFSSLRDELAIRGGKLLVSTLRDMISNKAVAQPQALENIRRAPMITPEDAEVKFSTMDSTQIHRVWRAISHQRPITTHTPDGQPLQLLSLAVADPFNLGNTILPSEPGSIAYSKPAKCLYVRCAEGTVLTVTKFKAAGKAERDATQFWNGLHHHQTYWGKSQHCEVNGEGPAASMKLGGDKKTES